MDVDSEPSGADMDEGGEEVPTVTITLVGQNDLERMSTYPYVCRVFIQPSPPSCRHQVQICANLLHACVLLKPLTTLRACHFCTEHARARLFTMVTGCRPHMWPLQYRVQRRCNGCANVFHRSGTRGWSRRLRKQLNCRLGLPVTNSHQVGKVSKAPVASTSKAPAPVSRKPTLKAKVEDSPPRKSAEKTKEAEKPAPVKPKASGKLDWSKAKKPSDSEKNNVKGTKVKKEESESPLFKVKAEKTPPKIALDASPQDDSKVRLLRSFYLDLARESSIQLGAARDEAESCASTRFRCRGTSKGGETCAHTYEEGERGDQAPEEPRRVR